MIAFLNLRGMAALAVLVLMPANPVRATSFDAPGNFNPILPGYFADPTIEQFGDTFYVYATTDGNGGGRGPATAWVSRDFVNWVLVPMNWPTTPHYWAPDVLKRPDGRYYLYRDTLRYHEYRPEHAVDDNNATLWRPGDNRMGHWLRAKAALSLSAASA